MASPTGATSVRLKIAPQRGQVLALVEIIAPHARHEVILDMTLPAPPATNPLSNEKQADLGSSEGPDMFTAMRSRPEIYEGHTLPDGRRNAPKMTEQLRR